MQIKCSHVTEAWGPDPGCREFMVEPEVIQCRELAVGVVVLRDLEDSETVVLSLCPHHLEREFINIEGLPPWMDELHITTPAG